MVDDAAASQRRAANRLTTVKLALQVLERNTELSEAQRHVVRMASDATNGLVSELTEQWRAQQDAVDRPPSSRDEPTAMRRLTDAPTPIHRAQSRRRLPPRPTKGAALLIAVALLVLALLGPALLLGLVAVLLFVAAVAWVVRR